QGDAFLPQIDRFLVDAIDSPDIIAIPSATDRDVLRTRATRLARETWQNTSRYDEILKEKVANWQPERLALTDHAILRMALHEMLDDDSVPPKTAIDEAIELAKTFGGVDSPRFVNGVLDAVYRSQDSNAQPPGPLTTNQ